MTSQAVADEEAEELEEEFVCAFEHLVHTDETMNKVRSAINKAIRENDNDNVALIDELIIQMKNAGILFRERAEDE